MDFQRLIEYYNHSNPFAAYLGITVTRLELGYAEVSLNVRPELKNPVDLLHGGCLYTMADIAAAAAGSSYGNNIVTLAGEYQYISPVKTAGTVKAVARCLRSGKTILPFEVEVFGPDGALVGKAGFTTFRLDQQITFSP